MKFTSNKVINLGSAAFRQWKSTHSHCQYIHGYNLTADITFEAEELDDKGWVADFGGLKDLKTTLEHTFDHKLVVAGDDPLLEKFTNPYTTAPFSEIKNEHYKPAFEAAITIAKEEIDASLEYTLADDSL